MTVRVSDGSGQQHSGGGAPMVLRSRLASVAEITRRRGGLPGFLIAELGGELGRWF
jgi:hypothetical protein